MVGRILGTWVRHPRRPRSRRILPRTLHQTMGRQVPCRRRGKRSNSPSSPSSLGSHLQLLHSRNLCRPIFSRRTHHLHGNRTTIRYTSPGNCYCRWQRTNRRWIRRSTQRDQFRLTTINAMKSSDISIILLYKFMKFRKHSRFSRRLKARKRLTKRSRLGKRHARRKPSRSRSRGSLGLVKSSKRIT